MAPTAASECHASLTVVGDTPSCVASSRTVGRRVPTGSSPAVIMRPMTPAMRRALRASLPRPASSATLATMSSNITDRPL